MPAPGFCSCLSSAPANVRRAHLLACPRAGRRQVMRGLETTAVTRRGVATPAVEIVRSRWRAVCQRRQRGRLCEEACGGAPPSAGMARQGKALDVVMGEEIYE